jgi:serine/threonine-protein kinase
LVERIGTGGVGTVYRAYQARLERDVAIKVMPNSHLDEEDQLKRFRREAKTIAKLQHPHIIPIYDFGVEPGISYIVMPLLAGGSLQDWVSDAGRSLPSLGRVAELLRAIGSALDWAHKIGIVHRDIKPSNILFDEGGNPYLVDFGIAKVGFATTKLTETGTTMGTPTYMAPEQWAAMEASASTDQYAVGIIAYLLTTGRLPFQAKGLLHLMNMHMKDFPTPPHDIRQGLPSDLGDVLNVALAKHPDDRFPSVTAFAKTFEYVVREGSLQMSGHAEKMAVGDEVNTLMFDAADLSMMHEDTITEMSDFGE